MMPIKTTYQNQISQLAEQENHFPYFTDIEEHFRTTRGTCTFNFSPSDWAIIERWQNDSVPLEAALRGIDETFEKWRSRKINTRIVNSLAYCEPAVLREAQSMLRTSNAPLLVDQCVCEPDQATDVTAVDPSATRMPFEQANAFLDRVFGRMPLKIPRPLKMHLQRTGEMISPKDLEQRVRTWNRCPECHDQGTVGNVLEKTLAYCGCISGQESRYAQGVDWVEREIARVHADCRSVLVTALLNNGEGFSADAIETAEITDDGVGLTIRLGSLHWFMQQVIKASYLQDILARCGYKRTVTIERKVTI